MDKSSENHDDHKKVRFNDDVVVHEVRRLYTKNMWIGTREVEANMRSVKKQHSRMLKDQEQHEVSNEMEFK